MRLPDFFMWKAKKKKNVTKCPYIVTNEGNHKKDFSVFYDHVTFLMMQRFILWHKDLFYPRAGNKKRKNIR